MSKSTMDQVIAVIRQVNTLDRKGRLAALKDLQHQGLEQPAAKRQSKHRLSKANTVADQEVPS